MRWGPLQVFGDRVLLYCLCSTEYTVDEAVFQTIVISLTSLIIGSLILGS